MEDLEEQREYINKKNLIDMLVKKGFLKNKKKLENNKKFEILEYPKEVLEQFLDFTIDLKENSEERLVINKLRNDKEEYSNKPKKINHYLYSDLLEENLDTDKSDFLLTLLEEIEDLTKNRDLGTDFIKGRVETPKEIVGSILHLRTCVREMKIISKDVKIDLNKITYKEKIYKLIEDLDILTVEGFYNKSWLTRAFYEQKCQTIYYDVFQQLIIYDIIHESIPKNEREIGYKKMLEFLESFLALLEKKIDNVLDTKEKKEDIFIDFFSFLIIRERLIKDRNILEIARNIKDDIYSGIKPLSKEKQLIFYISRQINETEKTDIDCINFCELDEIKDKIDKNTLTIPLEECKDLVKKFTNKEISEIIYGDSNIKRNFSQTYKNLMEIIEKYPFLSGKNLQAIKALALNIENDKREIKPLRKTLKALINDKNKELRETETVLANIRVRITKGLFIEKGNFECFSKSIDLEIILNKILEKIFILKNNEKRKEYMNEFIKEFFILMMEINSGKEVIAPREKIMLI